MDNTRDLSGRDIRKALRLFRKSNPPRPTAQPWHAPRQESRITVPGHPRFRAGFPQNCSSTRQRYPISRFNLTLPPW
ncbi:MAG: hypothetical protein AB1402_07160 [Bacillota bacterium]